MTSERKQMQVHGLGGEVRWGPALGLVGRGHEGRRDGAVLTASLGKTVHWEGAVAKDPSERNKDPNGGCRLGPTSGGAPELAALGRLLG
jgi:hypothetical protein